MCPLFQLIFVSGGLVEIVLGAQNVCPKTKVICGHKRKWQAEVSALFSLEVQFSSDMKADIQLLVSVYSIPNVWHQTLLLSFRRRHVLFHVDVALSFQKIFSSLPSRLMCVPVPFQWQYNQSLIGSCLQGEGEEIMKLLVGHQWRECSWSNTSFFLDLPSQMSPPPLPKLTCHPYWCAIPHHSTNMPVKVSPTDMPPPHCSKTAVAFVAKHQVPCVALLRWRGHISCGDFDWHVGGVMGDGMSVAG